LQIFSAQATGGGAVYAQKSTAVFVKVLFIVL